MTSVGAVNSSYNLSFGHTNQDKSKQTEPSESKVASARNNPYGVKSISIRDDLPVAERRELTPQEQQDVETGLSSWLPKIFPGYNTKPTELLASPEKMGAMSALGLGGLTAAVLGTFLTVKDGLFNGFDPLITAGAALLTGGIGFVTTFLSQRNSNEDTLDLMRRLPEGATRRDMLADPLYRQEKLPFLWRNQGQTTLYNNMF